MKKYIYIMNHQNNRHYNITYWTLCQKIILLLIYYGFNIYFTYSYITIPSNFSENKENSYFLVYIILLYIATIPTLIEAIYTYRYIGHRMTKNLWNIALPINTVVLRSINLSSCLGCLVLGCYFMAHFMPIAEKNCDTQEYTSKHVCMSFKIILVYTAIFVGFIALIFSCIFLLSCYWCFCVDSEQTIEEKHRLNKVAPHLPVIKTVPNNTICAICLEDPVENCKPIKNQETSAIKDKNIVQNNPNNKWISLNCAHKLHQDCATSWLSINPICPLCRALQPVHNLPTIVIK